jgi:hypothetical protein
MRQGVTHVRLPQPVPELPVSDVKVATDFTAQDVDGNGLRVFHDLSEGA